MRSDKRTIMMVIGAVLLMGGVIAWLLSSKPTAGTVKKAKETDPHQVIGSTIEENKDGRKVWSLTVESMVYDRKAQIDHMKGIKGTFYDEDGSTMTVTADEGDVDVKTKSVILTKNPKGTTSTNGTVTADKIPGTTKADCHCRRHARLTKDDVVATGGKATFNVPMEHATLEQDAHVQKGDF